MDYIRTGIFMRLNKFIASAGVSSRRNADELIKKGRVSLNGEIVTEMGIDVSDEDIVEVDGRVISEEKKKYYIVLNKPKGYITTTNDQFGRNSVTDLTKDINARLFPVGRLDCNTEGLLMMTNDGNFANSVTHPRNKVYKTYIARVFGFPSIAQIQTLKKGVQLEDGITAPAKVEIIKEYPRGVDIKISIYEGRNRQIRRMIEAIGFEVTDLKRVAVGNLLLGHLPSGKWRHMTEREVGSFMRR